MLILFLVLTLLSILTLVVGFIWIMVTRGESSHNRGSEVGAQIMENQIGEDESSVTQKMVFKGKATSYRREATMSFAEIKAQLASGRYSEALPMMLVVGGLLGMLTFGSLALLVAIENKLIGGGFAFVVIFSVLRIVVRMVRS